MHKYYICIHPYWNLVSVHRRLVEFWQSRVLRIHNWTHLFNHVSLDDIEVKQNCSWIEALGHFVSIKYLDVI